MKLDQIFAEWEQDSNIDITEIGEETQKISKLHHKYYQILSHERMHCYKLEAELKQLKLDKHEFYTQGPSKETIDKGWKLPAVGRVLRTDVTNYLEADNEIINLSLRIGLQKEKIQLLDSIIKTVMNRGYNLRLMHDDIKFKMGAI